MKNLKRIKRVGPALLLGLYLAACTLCIPAGAVTIEPDPEIHRVVGGLYTLAAAVCLNLNETQAVPSQAQLRRYFASVPADWLSSVQVVDTGSSRWVGVPVERFSTARRFLRAHAPELKIMDSAGGRPWMGGETAWLEAAKLTGQGKKISAKPAVLLAALSSENKNDKNDKNDKKENLFFSDPAQDFWWQADPVMTASARAAVLKLWGTKSSIEGLHAPAGKSSGNEEFKASPVSLPEDMHTAAEKDEFSVEMGDMIFNPVPRMNKN